MPAVDMMGVRMGVAAASGSYAREKAARLLAAGGTISPPTLAVGGEYGDTLSVLFINEESAAFALLHPEQVQCEIPEQGSSPRPYAWETRDGLCLAFPHQSLRSGRLLSYACAGVYLWQLAQDYLVRV